MAEEGSSLVSRAFRGCSKQEFFLFVFFLKPVVSKGKEWCSSAVSSALHPGAWLRTPRDTGQSATTQASAARACTAGFLGSCPPAGHRWTRTRDGQGLRAELQEEPAPSFPAPPLPRAHQYPRRTAAQRHSRSRRRENRPGLRDGKPHRDPHSSHLTPILTVTCSVGITLVGRVESLWETLHMTSGSYRRGFLHVHRSMDIFAT